MKLLEFPAAFGIFWLWAYYILPSSDLVQVPKCILLLNLAIDGNI